MKNRYLFFKRLFPEYVIIFANVKGFKTKGKDKYLMKYIKNNDINYIIVYNDNSFDEFKYNKNNYKKYIIRLFLYELIDKKNTKV